MALKLASMRVRVYWLIYAKNSISYELLLISNYAGINATQAAQNEGDVEQIKNDETTRATMQSSTGPQERDGGIQQEGLTTSSYFSRAYEISLPLGDTSPVVSVYRSSDVPPSYRESGTPVIC